MALTSNTRRRFLRGCIGLAAWFAARSSSAARRDAHGSDTALLARLLACVGDVGAAAQLGRCYLAQHPGEASTAQLLRGLVGDMPAGPRVPADDLRHHIAARQRRDFADGATVMVDGWILSLSEARLYALCALI